MKSLPHMVLAALFTGLMVAGALIAIPFPGVPLVIANAFPWLAGLLLGPLWAGVSTALYVLLGTLGLPVFAGGHAGIGGPTTGFLLGYIVSAVVVGLARDSRGQRLAWTTGAVVLGLVSQYLVGVTWMVTLFGKVFYQYFLPQLVWYLVGDVVKAFAVVALARVLVRLPGVSDRLGAR